MDKSDLEKWALKDWLLLHKPKRSHHWSVRNDSPRYADDGRRERETMKKFELFMGCLGNGITVCNKAVMENGDYKTISHIAECGKITWYVNPSTYIPDSELLKIEHEANAQGEKWEKWLTSMPEIKQYEYLLDNAPHAAFMHVVHMDGKLGDKIQYLKSALYQKSTF